MRRAAVVVALMSLGVCFVHAQEEPKPPKDSVQLVVTGCLDKRVLDAADIQPADIDVPVRSFHLSAKKEVMAQVKDHNKQRVEVTGWVRKIDLAQPGFKVGRSRIVLGPAPGNDPMRPQVPEQTNRILVMEAVKIQMAPGDCGRKK